MNWEAKQKRCTHRWVDNTEKLPGWYLTFPVLPLAVPVNLSLQRCLRCINTNTNTTFQVYCHPLSICLQIISCGICLLTKRTAKTIADLFTQSKHINQSDRHVQNNNNSEDWNHFNKIVICFFEMTSHFSGVEFALTSKTEFHFFK